MSLLAELKQLANEGAIRFLDYQFARFMQQLGATDLEQYVAAAVSHALEQGHVCVDLTQLHQGPFAVSFNAQEKLRNTLNSSVDQWPGLLAKTKFIGDVENNQQPLILENNKIYLQRYWHYEQVIKGYLVNQPGKNQFDDIYGPLNRLFVRDYDWLLTQYLSAMKQDKAFQTWCVDSLDIEISEHVENSASIDWPKVEQLFAQAQQGTDLQSLDQLIPESVCLNWQKLATAVAVAQPFAVISGGPGTGKTTTIIKVLALLVELHQQKNESPLVIKLAAPTGKAAARLTESIGGAKGRLQLEAKISDAVPEQSSTLHRLLGVIPGSGKYRHHKDNPLHLDVLVLDEASMIDLPMMAALLEAMPKNGRLILLGDKDQLASVEAGAVLGDIFSFYQQGYSQQQINWLEKSSDYDLSKLNINHQPDSVANGLSLLKKSYRFDSRSGIGQLARIVNQGLDADLNSLWKQDFSDICLHSDNVESQNSYQTLLDLVVKGYGQYLAHLKPVPQDKANNYAQQLLQAFGQCQVLAAVREGDFGVEGLNQRIAQALQSAGLINQRSGDWYQGRPVMIVRNDYSLGLFNGDIGLCLAETNEFGDEKLRVYFQLPDGSIKSFLPSRLPEHQTAYAMTIHKSQGSEFNHTLMVLPPRDNPVLTRELVYTGITRAKQQLDIFSSNDILINAVRRPTARISGLEAQLGEINPDKETIKETIVKLSLIHI